MAVHKIIKDNAPYSDTADFLAYDPESGPETHIMFLAESYLEKHGLKPAWDKLAHVYDSQPCGYLLPAHKLRTSLVNVAPPPFN